MKKLLLVLLLLPLGLSAQVFKLDSLPKQGILLDKGWKWQAGDNPEFAKADFDDKSWQPLNPDIDISDLPQIPKTGEIFWLRLHLSVDSSLNQQLVMMIQQSGASEIYLNGKLIQHFGVLSKNAEEIRAYNPKKEQIPFTIQPSSPQVLAIRYALQPHIFYCTHWGYLNKVVSINLNSTENLLEINKRTDVFIANDPLMVGVYGILCVLYLTFYLVFRTPKTNLYFSLYAFISTIIYLSSIYDANQYYVAYRFWMQNINITLYVIGCVFLLLAVYRLFAQKVGMFFWIVVIVGIISILTSLFIYLWGWQVYLYGFNNIITFEVIRIAIISIIKRKKGAWIIAIGGFVAFITWVSFLIDSVYMSNYAPYIYLLSNVGIPLSVAIFIGYDFAQTNRSLQQKLVENESLSTEKQQILSTQNETLEKKVVERTAELELKNRDLEIEAALEKVRSRSLAMHKSDELREVVTIVFEKLKNLGLAFQGAGIQLYKENSRDITEWASAPDLLSSPTLVSLPFSKIDFEESEMFKDVLNGKENKVDIFNKSYSESEINRYFTYLGKFNGFSEIPEEVRKFQLEAKIYAWSLVVEKNTGIWIDSWIGQTISETDFLILKRVARVFEQAYTRFLDLQKAEAQAREGQIELALEKVRSRTMAMQKSEELPEISSLLFQQVKELGVTAIQNSIGIVNEETKFVELSTTIHGSYVLHTLNVPIDDPYVMVKAVTAWKAKCKSLTLRFEGQELKNYNELRNSFLKTKVSFPEDQWIVNISFFSKGWLSFSTDKNVSDEIIVVLKKFAAVFDQTYTRFLDLQKAEAQAEQARLDLILIQTEKKRAEEALKELKITQNQLIQKEKLASLGELTAGIAHEIQNPLNFVNNFSELSIDIAEELKDEIKKPEKDWELIEELMGDLTQNQTKINHHGKRASNIVKGMLEHSRTGTGERVLTDINALTTEYLRLSLHGMKAKNNVGEADFMTDFDPNLPKIEVIPQEIGRVLLNLLNNAFYAVGQVSNARRQVLSHVVKVTTKALENAIEIKVKDNGNGIPENIKEKIFQPFFTTKPTGEGSTGLGLSLSYDIITKGHGGTLEVVSVEGEGAEFTVKLPLK